MPKVTFHEDQELTPSETIIRGAKKTATVTDALGRTIKIKKLTPLVRMKMASVVGPEDALNQVVFGYALLAASVTEIDGTPWYLPASGRELEALLGVLDDEGVEAVQNGQDEHFGAIDANSAKGTEAAKNS
jgi:hypothetical protein